MPKINVILHAPRLKLQTNRAISVDLNLCHKLSSPASKCFMRVPLALNIAQQLSTVRKTRCTTRYIRIFLALLWFSSLSSSSALQIDVTPFYPCLCSSSSSFFCSGPMRHKKTPSLHVIWGETEAKVKSCLHSYENRDNRYLLFSFAPRPFLLSCVVAL